MKSHNISESYARGSPDYFQRVGLASYFFFPGLIVPKKGKSKSIGIGF